MYTASQMCLQTATQELGQDILAPMFQSAHQLARQNLVVTQPTSPQEVESLHIFPGEVRGNALAEGSQRAAPAMHMLTASWPASSSAPKGRLKLAAAICHLLHIQG